MAKTPSKTDNPEIAIQIIKQGQMVVRIVGTTPLYFNSMGLKAKQTLLLGGAKKTAAEKAQIKHNPEAEFRDSTYKTAAGPTLLCLPAAAFKGAMATAALATPGMKKTDVQRLVFLPEQFVPIWGVPYLKMDVVRSADMNKTPDVRTRAFLPQWCAQVEVRFATPHLSAHGIISLLANAGIVCGVGDFRQEKGRGGFGTFSPVDEADAVFAEIQKQDRAAQQAALDHPRFADDATAELMELVSEARIRRVA